VGRPKPTPEGFKYCSGCKQTLPLESFGLHKGGSQGRRNQCRECRNTENNLWSKQNIERVSKWRKTNPDKLKEQRDRWNRSEAKKVVDKKWKASHPNYKYIPSEYGMSIEDYQELFDEQGGVCAICGNPETRQTEEKFNWLCIDHNHETGEIRGLLCSKCNRSLGLFGDSIDFLYDAVRYLERYE
jgi:hypothetical protein